MFGCSYKSCFYKVTVRFSFSEINKFNTKITQLKASKSI